MTIKDVAEKSGVSVSTVSRVLNDHPDVSEKVRNRVMAVVNELHYVPNNSARDLIKSEAETIGVIVRGSDNTFFTPVTVPRAPSRGSVPSASTFSGLAPG